jgi:hypothetical protein
MIDFLRKICCKLMFLLNLIQFYLTLKARVFLRILLFYPKAIQDRVLFPIMLINYQNSHALLKLYAFYFH